jgi:hypothetical protein
MLRTQPDGSPAEAVRLMVWTARGTIAKFDTDNGQIKIDGATRHAPWIRFHVHALVREKNDKRTARVILTPGTPVEFDAQPNGEGHGWSAVQVRPIKQEEAT